MRHILFLLAITICSYTISAQEKINDFLVVAEGSPLPTGWYYVSDTPTKFKRQHTKDMVGYFIVPKPILVAENIVQVDLYANSHDVLGLIMYFDEEGSKLWMSATENYVSKKLAFILNDKLIHTPIVESPLSIGIASINNGKYSKAELEKIKKEIKKEH